MKKIVFCLIFAIAVVSLKADMVEPDKGETELMRACRNSSSAEVELLLKSGAEVNVKTKVHKKVALDFALENTHPFEMISLLLNNGAELSRAPNLLMNTINKRSNQFPNPETPAELEKLILLLLEKNVDCDFDEVLAASARYCQNPEIFEKLIKLGANVNSRTTQNYPPLISALGYRTNRVALTFLLEHGADSNIRDFGDKPATYFANSNEDLQLLLKYGTDLSAVQLGAFDEKGLGPFSSSSYKSFIVKPIPQINAWARWINAENLALAIDKNCTIDEKGMIEAGANPNMPQIYEQLLKIYGKNPPVSRMAQKAMEYGIVSNIEFLKQHGAESSSDRTNLFTAVFNSPYLYTPELREPMLRYLIEKHAPVNAVDSKTGRTALMSVAGSFNIENIKFLLENGADANIFDTNGFNSLFYLLSNPYYSDEKFTQKKIEMFELLLKYGAPLKQKNSTVNLLLIALISEQPPELIKRLVELGEDVNFKAGDDITPLMLAAMFYKSDIVELLIQKGAKINVRDDTGWSPLFYGCHYFLESRSLDAISFQPRNRGKLDANATVQLLLKNGADGSTLDDFGASPMTEAGAWANAETINLLLKAGGKRALNASDKHNRNAILYAGSCNSDLKAVEELLQAGADPNTIMKEGKYSERIMKFAQFNGIFNGPESFRVTSEKKFHNCAGFGWYDPPIYDAIRMKNTALVKLLLKYGADPNLQYKRESDNIYTPLTFNYAPSAEIEQILVNAGAKYDTAQGKKSIGSREMEQKFTEVCKGDNIAAVKTLYAKLPQMTQEEKKSFLSHSLNSAAWQGTLETVKFLIQENGGNFQGYLILNAATNAEHPDVIRYLAKVKPAALKEARSVHDQCTAMHYATSPEIIDFLIGEGFDVNIRNGRGETPLMWQLSSENHSYPDYNRGAVIKALIQRGTDINAQDNFGNNAAAKVLFSFSSSYDGSLKYLLKHGANPDTKIMGKALLDYAIERNETRKFEILVAAGANAALITNDLKDASLYIKRRVEELRQKLLTKATLP